MTDPTAGLPTTDATPDPADPVGEPETPSLQPGERAAPRPGPGAPRPLEVPPSQRYVKAARGATARSEGWSEPSLARGSLIGGLVALFHAVVLVVFGAVFTLTAGLIVVAVFLGRLTAVGVNAGAGGAGSPASRQAIAVGLSLGGIALAQVGLWLWAGFEGGTLGLVDFLVQVYGALVPLQLLLAGGVAWLSAR